MLLTDVGEDSFGEGKSVATLDNPTKDSVQAITLPKDTKARFVTLDLKRRNVLLKFREVEIYNGPLLGNSRNFMMCLWYPIFSIPVNTER